MQSDIVIPLHERPWKSCSEWRWRAFDSFLYLETTTKDLLLLAFQMKLADQDSQVISDNTVNHEFMKINDCVAKHLNGIDFLCIILGRCDGSFDESKIPSKCVVLSRQEQLEFYGPFYSQRLNNAEA